MAAQDQSERCLNDFESGNCVIPKVRKPYTITKQREKWTEEEHRRFIEALKLYGRAWRQIEEHVGTKTAVQIRSHAQKFFSKVARESNSGSESSLKPIEIPPPRPKRKPMHPYPRKSPNFKGSTSPTSVLSAFASEQVNGCSSPNSSPNSCTTDIQSGGLVSIEKENEYVTSKSSLEEEKTSSSLKLESGFKDSVCSEDEDVAATAPCKTIKLFGKTVLVTDSYKPSSRGMDYCKPPKSETGLSLRMVISNWTSLPSHAKLNSFSWENLKDKESTHDGSCTGSNAAGSVSQVDNQEKSLDAVDSRCKQVGNTRGFVPYKRCLAEREMKSPMVVSEEQERRRARVCS